MIVRHRLSQSTSCKFLAFLRYFLALVVFCICLTQFPRGPPFPHLHGIYQRTCPPPLGQVTNVDEVLQLHNDLLNGCMRDCMLTRPELLRTVSRLLAVCVAFVSFLQVGPAVTAAVLLPFSCPFSSRSVSVVLVGLSRDS